jgi:hypothetical protein
MSQLQQQLDEQRRRVDVDNFDVTVRELVRMAAEGELDRAPAYQRKFRWTETDESKLIESLLLGLPVPSVFVATNPNGTWEVVDGVQRISTLIHFIAEPVVLLSTIGKTSPLRLQGLEKVGGLNDKTYADLPTPIQLAINKRALRVTALSDKSDLKARFDMFERLNTGGVALTAQEVRACIYRGPFNDLLRELANGHTFRKLVKLQKVKQEDGTREELVLKFFAYLNNRQHFKGAVTEFLSEYMENADENLDIDGSRDLFNDVVARIYSVTRGPFVRKGYSNTPLNQLEAVMVAVGALVGAGARISKPSKNWLDDPELVRTSTGATNTASMLKARIDRATALWKKGSAH